ncbi:MAG TPA: DUF805 domain-containing protein [Candidatus Akkermansia intestinavium]|nr:DUF805 domain-containing protein [Candidatus Akkermansia intestinavium]
MNEFYYLDDQNETQGPVSLNDLISLMVAGRIQSTTLVARSGDAAWLPLTTVIAASNGAGVPPTTVIAANGGYHDGMGLWDIFKLTMTKNFAEFSGRATRREYWMFQLAGILFWFVFSFAVVILSGVLSLIDESLVIVAMFLSYLYPLAILIPSLGIFVRRLHDTGRSGWVILLGLIPFVGPIILFIFTLLDSQPGTNAYGSSLKYPNY